MAIIRSIPRKGRHPSHRGRYMVDAVRGVLRVRKWPKKRGTPKSASQRFWIDWFTQANFLAKYADGMSQARAIDMAKGSGMYPRDVLLKAMRGRLYTWADETGWKWYSVAAIEDISESLDVLAQTIGSVLVRATDRWRAVAAGTPGEVLTYQGSAAPPIWAVPSAAAGITQQELAGTPIIPDGSVNIYDIPVSSYALVNISLDNIALSASTRPSFRFSNDGGVTFPATMADYLNMWVSAGAQSTQDFDKILTCTPSSSANHHCRADFTNLRAGRATWNLMAGHAVGNCIHRSGFANFDSPITHIRVMTDSGANFNAGTIRAVGSVAA